MISFKKLIKMVRNWRKLATISRKRIAFARTTRGVHGAAADNCNISSSTADKGHFVVYTANQSRFVIPLVYLNNDIFRELLKMAEEEYGLPTDRPIIVPCDSVFMDYAVSLIRRRATKDLKKAFLMSTTTNQCLSSFCLQQGQSNQQPLICSC